MVTKKANRAAKGDDQSSTLLYRRLEEALQHGNEVEVVVSNGSFYGVPVNLDHDSLEIVNFYVPENRTSRGSAFYERTVWLIRLSEIIAVAYSIESWSKHELERLLGATETVSESEDLS
ncbi:MAG: hypothetical protein ACFBSC_13610 [Microcoleaceae cyanobacterium]